MYVSVSICTFLVGCMYIYTYTYAYGNIYIHVHTENQYITLICQFIIFSSHNSGMYPKIMPFDRKHKQGE